MTKLQPHITTAIIPAAGLGTRFLPLTKSQPKEMLPIVDKPAIQYVVEEAVQAGLTDILVITGRGKRAIEDHFDRNFELDHALSSKQKYEELEKLEEIESLANIHYVRQKQRDVTGLGNAVSVAQSYVGTKPFVVMLGDDIMVDDAKMLKTMLSDFDEKQTSIISLTRVDIEDISSYGSVAVDGEIDNDLETQLVEVRKIVEKPHPKDAPSNLAVTGRYVFTNEIFDCLSKIEPGYGGEIQLTDAISLLLSKQKVFGRIYSNGRYDIGQKVDWLIANIKLALTRDDLAPQLRKSLTEILEQDRQQSS